MAKTSASHQHLSVPCFLLAVFVVFAFVPCLPHSAFSQISAELKPSLVRSVHARNIGKRVLVLNSYHPGMRFSDEETRGIRENLPIETELFIEYMDTKRVRGEQYFQQLAQLYATKYRPGSFDAICSLDDNALRFLLRYKENLFGPIPVIFCGVSIPQPEILEQAGNVHGVLETLDLEVGIDFALRLFPQTKHIALITDPTTSGAANRKTFEQLARSGRFSQSFIFVDPDGQGLELDELFAAVKNLPEQTIIYHSDFFVDKQKNPINIEVLMPQLSHEAHSPIFVHNNVYMGLGVLGGKVNSGYDQGATAAKITREIWAHDEPKNIPVIREIPNRVMIDSAQLKRFNLTEEALLLASSVPKNEILFFNQPEDFWRGRGKYVFWGLGFIVFEGLLIAWLVRLFMCEKKLQIEANQASERFQALFELAPFACVLNDEQGRYLMVNKAFTTVTGIHPEQAIGHTSQEVGVLMSKEDVRRIKKELAQYKTLSSIELTLTLRPETTLHVLQASTLIDWDGASVILTASADITRIRQVEFALRESEERYRDLVQGAAVLIIKFNTKGVITFVNDYALDFFGFRRDELIGHNLTTTIVPENDSNGADLRPLINAACESSDVLFENINENTTKQGERVWIHWKNRVIREEKGAIKEIFSFGTDITKRKCAEEEQEKLRAQLLQSQKMESVGKLAGGVAHDFNNMLGVILGHCEMVLSSLGTEHELAHNLEQILSAANRSSELTKQLLAFARKQPIAPKVLDLNHNISMMIAMIRRLIGEDIELVWEPGNDLWAVHFDPTQLTQLLTNLCINARDAIDSNGRIIITTENIRLDEQACSQCIECHPGEYVQISVSDNGCGMDKQTQKRIFEPFFTTKALGQGTGLGLSMVSGIISQNNGFIHLDSEPATGTTFRLYLPRYNGEIIPDHDPEETTTNHQGQGKILLVEDEQVLLEMTTSMLEGLGYSVLSAASGSEALKLVLETPQPIDLLITDVVMPGMTGNDLARTLQQKYPDLTCLYISGYPADLVSFESAHFLEKPYTRKALAAKIQALLHT